MQKTLLLVGLLCLFLNSFAQTVPGDNCENAFNLADLTAPYSGSTASATNDFDFCFMGSSKDLVFFYDLEVGETLVIKQVSNNYDSRHSLRWGGACPGETEIACIDEPDTAPVGWINTTEDTQRVWFVLGGYSSNSGDFVLDWQVYPADACTPAHSLYAQLIGENTATIVWDVYTPASSWELIYGPEGFDPESEGEVLAAEGQRVLLNDLLPGTTYQAYVRALCSEELSSVWSAPVRFSTLEFCRRPRSVLVSSITTASATVSWTDGGNGAEWEVEYGPAGFTLGSGTRVEGLEATSVELSDLQHSTSYHLYVRSLCGGDEVSDWTIRTSFTTLCGALELPYFDDYSQGLNPCWQRNVQTGSGSMGLSFISEYLLLYARGGETFFSSPEFDADLSAAFLEFDLNFSRSGSGEQRFEIGLMSDPTDPASFISLRVMENEGLTSSVQKVRLLLGTVPATHRYISFRISAPEADNSINAYLDNLVLTADPGCYKPWDLGIKEKTEALVQLEWSSLPTISNWEVRYGLRGFDPSESGSLLELDQASAVLSDLQEAQDYDVYVRSTCGGELISDWEGPLLVRLPIPGDDCFSALNLADLTAPYSGSTSLASNDYSLCGMASSRELVFYYDLEVGESLVVGQVSNNYNSRHSLRWGSTCPGETEIACINDPDTQPVGWTNTTEDTQRVWFVLGGYLSGSGDFVLDWQVYPAGVCVPVRSVSAHSIGDNTATIAWELLVPGSSWEVIYGPEGFDPDSEGVLLVAEAQQVTLNDLLPETSYQAYVRTLCSAELTSAWSTPVSFTTLEFCRPPLSLSVSAITTSSATVGWTDGGNGAEWEVEYGPAGFTLGSGTRVEGLEATSVELSDLQHSTSYHLYVRSHCGGEEVSDWSSQTSFSTLCAPFELPFSEDFSQGMNPCWQRNTQTGFSSLQTSSERLRLYVSAGETFFSSPEFDADLSEAFLEFDLSFSRSGSPGERFEIGLMSDPSDPASFLSLRVMESETFTSSNQKVRLPMGTVPATHRYLTFRLSTAASGTYIYAYLDNLVLTADPGCYKPWDLRVTEKTEAVVQVEWSSLPTINTWEVSYGLSGFDPSESGSLLALDQASAVLSDLQEGQNYDVYVRSTCGGELGSDWEGPLVVRLPIPGDDCSSALNLAELTAPYSGSTSLASNDYSLCGMGSSRELVFYYDLEVGESLVIWQASNNYDSRHTLRWGGTCPGETQIACIDDPDTQPVGWTNTTEDKQRVWFILGGYSTSSGDFVLDWQVYPAGVCVPVRSVRAQNIGDNTATLSWDIFVPASSWEVIYGPEGFDPDTEGEMLVAEEQQVVLNDLLPETSYQAYVRTLCGEELASEWSTSVSFSTLVFCRVPRSVAVSSITTASATVSWTDGGNGAEWEVEYGPAGFTLGSGTRVEGLEATLVEISDLQHSTSYDLYVRSHCGGEEVSDWSSQTSFSTLCAPLELPFSEDFSQGMNPCWQRNTQTGFSSLQTSSERLRLYVSAGETFFSSPEFDADLSEAFLEFDLSFSRSGSPGERFEIGLMSDPSDPASFLSLRVMESEAMSSSNQKIRLPMGTVPATHRYVSFRLSTLESGNYIYAYLDNLVLTADPGCYKPWDLVIKEKTEAMVQVEWSSLTTISNWEVIYGLSGFDPSESGSLLALDEASAVLSDLQEEQNYDVYVRSTCGGDLVSDWDGPLVLSLPIPGDDCSSALNLAELTAPYSGTTSLANNDFSLCYMNNSKDLVFYYDVEAGAAIEIVQLGNDFDSRHALRWGGACPGTTEIACIDEPDTAPVFWYNHTEVTQRVWFILGGYSSSSGPFVLNWTYFEPGSCLPPVDLHVADITGQTAQLSWTDISNASEWEVRVSMDYGQETLVYNTITSVPMLTLEGLEPGTAYNVKVRSICGEGVSTRKVSTSFTTTCGLLTLPYFAEFGQNGKADCWRFVSNWDSYYYTYESTEEMRYYLATGVATHALPQVGELFDGAVLRFNISDVEGVGGVIQVGSMSSASDSTSFVPFISRELDANSVNMEIGVELPVLPEGHSFLALRLINNSENQNLLVIKDFSIQEKTDCEVPTQLRASSVTHDAAQVSWIPLGIEASWELRVGAPGFDPESEGVLYQTESPEQVLNDLIPDTGYEVVVRPLCTNGAEWSKSYLFSTEVACPAPYNLSVMPVSPQSVLVDWAATDRAETWSLSYWPVNSSDRQEVLVDQAPPFLVEGLIPGEGYTFSVVSLCGEDYGNSRASQQVSSFTACDGVKSLPYVADWSNLQGGFRPYCWDVQQGSSTYNEFGVSSSYNFGQTGLEFYVDGAEGDITALLPELEGDMSAMKMQLKLFKDFGTGTLEIGVWDEQDFHLLETISLPAISVLWKDYLVLLDNASGHSGRLGLRFRTGNDRSWGSLFVGALEVDWQSDCERPYGFEVQDLTSNSATLLWEQIAFPSEVELLWGPLGFDPDEEGSVVELDGAVGEYALEGLSPASAYEVYWRNQCDDESWSDWSAPFVLNTPCLPLEIGLTDVEEGTVFSLEEEVVLEVTYAFACTPNSVDVYLVNQVSGNSTFLGDFMLTEEGSLALRLPRTLSSGNYRLEMSYTDLLDNGARGRRSAFSSAFGVSNTSPRIEVMRPSDLNAVVHSAFSSIYLSWNVFMLSEVDVLYSVDGGENWMELFQELVCYSGSSFYGVNGQSIATREDWLGETLVFKFVSSTDPDVYALSPGVMVLAQNPFRIVSTGLWDVPLGSTKDIEYEADIALDILMQIEDDRYNVLSTQLVSVAAGTGTLQFPTEGLKVGESYIAWISAKSVLNVGGSGYGFTVVVPTSLNEIRQPSAEIQLYPVPVEDLLYIHAPALADGTHGVLYDLSGRRLMDFLLSETPLNLSHLKTGVYLLVIDGRTFKVVKE